MERKCVVITKQQNAYTLFENERKNEKKKGMKKMKWIGTGGRNEGRQKSVTVKL